MPKELTKFQVSSRLEYQQSVPKFLRRYQNDLAGRPNTPPSEGEEDEWVEGAVDEFGREIRKPSPSARDRGEREGGGRGGGGEGGRGDEEGMGRLSDEEEGGEDAPQIVVLKEGKHLSAFEAENEKRLAKGLPPLKKEDILQADLEKGEPNSKTNDRTKTEEKVKQSLQSLNFSSSSTTSKGTSKGAPSTGTASMGVGRNTNKAKRKIAALSNDLDDYKGGEVDGKGKKVKKEKKEKKEKKGLLSFGDGND